MIPNVAQEQMGPDFQSGDGKQEPALVIGLKPASSGKLIQIAFFKWESLNRYGDKFPVLLEPVGSKMPVGQIKCVSGFIKIVDLPATVIIREDTPAGVPIFNFSVVSTIGEISLTPKIADTNPVNNFFTVSVRRDLYLEVIVSENQGLDYETQSNYVLLIYVVDNNGNADFQTLTVLLSDVNEPPRFLDHLVNGAVYVDFLENLAVGAMIYEFQATDPDRDDDILSYSVNSSLVTINSSGKNGAILAAKTFDYEKDFHSFSVLVTVKDATGNSITAIVVVNLVNLNDNWPVFKENKTILNIFEEKPPNSVIGKVTAYDSDDDDASSSLIYFMSSANRYFTINSVTGELIVLTIIDRDNGPFRDFPTQEFEVAAKDSPFGGHTASLTVIVIVRDINDNQPSCFPHTHSIQVPETTEKGAAIVTISCKDNDADLANSQFTTSLQPGLRTDERFAMDGKNNTIVVIGNLDFEAATNFEDNNVYVMAVVVTDTAPPHYQDTVTVYVRVTPVDEFRPSFTQTSYTFNISEFSENNSVPQDRKQDAVNHDSFGIHVEALLPLTVCSPLYVEVAGSSTDVKDPFGIWTRKRQVKVTLKVAANGAIIHPRSSFAIGGSRGFSVYAGQPRVCHTRGKSGHMAANCSTVICKTCKKEDYQTKECKQIGTKIGQVLAEDKDFPGLELIYSVIGGGNTLGYSQLFWINPTSGEIYLVAQPDYETTAQYFLTVQAVEIGSDDPKAATTIVTVNILPTNDEPPDCQPKFYSLMILDNTAVGSNIQGFQLSCTDRDSSPHSFRYFITSGNINNHFRLSPSAGSNISKLILALPFDYTHGVDKVTDYNLIVQITDDNLLAGSRERKVVQTGRVKINIRIIIPTPSTKETTTTPNITYIRLSQNTYQADAWYIPFIITLGCLLLLGMLGYLAYLLAQYIRSIPKSKVKEKPLMEEQELKPKKQHDVILEMVTRNTIFDGEAVDPVTGNVYQYNTNSGARRWKDTKLPMKDYGNARDAIPNFTLNINKTNKTTFAQNSNMEDVHSAQNTMQKTHNGQHSPKPTSKLGKQIKVAPRLPEAPKTQNSLANI
ncbi:cadherin-related family member 3-like [Heterodontus francisci]|uniref:cadherin-related family member 3-like n=1 Tax=Heterodontus francisci TaxID=7792 RepID=UPI00355BF241